MSDLEQAARQAMEALELHAKQYPYMQKGYTVDAIASLRQALEQKREWVGLTDGEVRAAYCAISDKEWAIGGMSDAEPFARAIEAKLRELNT